MKQKSTRAISAFVALPLFLSTFIQGQQRNNDEEEIFELSPFEVSSPSFGVTAGGAQDIAFTRSQIAMGKIPQPTSFTAEGLLSEYDLPLNEPSRGANLINVFGEAMPVSLPELPEATHLAQIGFSSGIDAASWERAPLNLIAVVDKSGSMSGRPLDLVRLSLLEALDQLGEKDQLSIVLYGDRSHVYLEPIATSPFNKKRIRNSILGIQSAGSTNLEHGLKVGYSVADETAPDFEGTTRLMLFTDERPNTGNTSEHGFMRQMREGSNKGYGLTTIGVGTHFGAELANTISSVRGGNLFFFPDAATMQDKFANEFETMVTELAYDMKLTLSPAEGFKIVGVYGIPGDMLQWTDDGRSLYMKVETLFLSLRKGAIYFALASQNTRPFSRATSDEIAQASLSYQMGNQKFPISQTVSLPLQSQRDASVGLRRGEALIDEYISLKKATTLYHEQGDVERAYRIVSNLADRFQNHNDNEIRPEKKLIKEIEKNLAIVSKNDEKLFDEDFDSPISGCWIADPSENPELGSATLLTFHSSRIIEVTLLDELGNPEYESYAIASKAFSKRRHGQLRMIDEYLIYDLAGSNERLHALANSADYASDISRIDYKLRGDRLVLTVYDEYGNEENVMQLTRHSKDTAYQAPFRRAEIEPITGLPSRS
ncbi:VWA domain-containing protein [Pelagicoccus sp. SDUM812003]|uniref:vWA domain-containing protein n=1 Tax=Pelagicoccus sp. SDUM812003 TaxID=3041267 RepID=UPI00280CF886|nr:VWA domain-containing protein [Pelagicoccus sp. SDUM812003]MDQ8203563.1 VWA domain-containing protein [Pelagicoccus sp. SDUM812003]